ncbi:MAG: ASKHA domain-containing protein [Clostridiales Family XIII bacterium]|jgi:uncharacterized 2Fe-2S/4Fe-4S cluster protein (DUF4445 family)|nr:ASKHA domain-containing protein [Clostridiales Family XIII bacterium]
MKKYNVRFVGTDTVVRAEEGASLLDVIRANGIDIAADCGGRGRCGKCGVVVDGEPRLACETKVVSDISVALPERSGAYDILTDFGGGVTSAGGGTVTSGVAGAGVVSERAGTSAGAGECAIAIDIGTTTVVAKLIGLPSGEDVWAVAELNEQRVYGADVISRINASMDDSSLLSGVIVNQLDRMVSKLLAESGTDAARVARVVVAGNTTMCYLLLGLPCRSLGLAPFEPAFQFNEAYTYNEVFRADTLQAPVHILPFISAFIGGDITAGLLTLDGKGGEQHVTEAPSAVIAGADPQSTPSPAIEAEENANDLGSYILVDMGTNGEIAYHSNNGLLCTSTAAGPAFEGGNISCGSGSVEGAISRLELANGANKKFRYETIGGGAAHSICGSGILDAMACFADAGIVKPTGALNKKSPLVTEDGVPIAEGVTITQKDVREFQLAKSAIRAGIETLISESGGIIPDRLYLAGGFGQHLDPESAFRIGLIPEALRGKVIPIGNSSLAGAALAALTKPAAANAASPQTSEDYLKTAGAIASRGREINLATHPTFNKLFMEHMMF